MTDHLYLTVFAVTDTQGNKFFFRQKYDPYSSGKIDAPESAFKLRHGNWTIKPEGANFRLKADSTDFGIDLVLSPKKPPIPMGKDGFAQYASCDGCGTHYYVFSRLLTEGTLTVNGEPKKVIGLSFNEHQWGTKLLDSKELGWLWTCIQFANDTELILCHFPKDDGTFDSNSQAAIIRPDASVEYFKLNEFKMKPLAKWRSETSKQLYPVGSDIEIPKLGLRVVTMPDVLNQELQTSGFTYYEGHGTAVADFGAGRAVTGVGAKSGASGPARKASKAKLTVTNPMISSKSTNRGADLKLRPTKKQVSEHIKSKVGSAQPLSEAAVGKRVGKT